MKIRIARQFVFFFELNRIRSIAIGIGIKNHFEMFTFIQRTIQNPTNNLYAN